MNYNDIVKSLVVGQIGHSRNDVKCVIKPCDRILFFLMGRSPASVRFVKNGWLLWFLCLRYKVAGGIMFSGCPSVRTYVRSRDRVISRTNWWIPSKLGSCMYLTEPMNWLDFGVTRLKVKGRRAHYVCKNSSWSHYLKYRSIDSCQTWVMYVSNRANELIRFWGHKVEGQRSQGSLYMQK